MENIGFGEGRPRAGGGAAEETESRGACTTSDALLGLRHFAHYGLEQLPRLHKQAGRSGEFNRARLPSTSSRELK